MTQSTPKLEVRHLAVLAAIDSARTFADAAHLLSITPSALSHRLREAERRLALPLLTGSGGRRLNEAGKRMLLAARRCLAEMELAEREARSAGRAAREVVRLGASTWCGYAWLPDLLRRLEADEPKIDVEVVMEVSLDPVTALRDRRIDLAVIPARARGRELIKTVPGANRSSGRSSSQVVRARQARARNCGASCRPDAGGGDAQDPLWTKSQGLGRRQSREPRA